MILKDKIAVIYGGGGSMGGAIARAFAAAGARVCMAGRNLASVQSVANEILASGGMTEAAEVDALEEDAIKNHMDAIVNKWGKIDICFNAVGINVKQNIALIDLTQEEFVRPIALNMQTQFLTAASAGRIMMKQGSGVILTLTATPGGIGYPYTGAFAPACCAIECLSQNLASELGVYGVRAVNIRSGGSPDSKVFKEAIENNPEEMAPILKNMEADTMLKALPHMADIANAAVFLSSNMAEKITGITVDITCGTTAGLNYRTRSPIL